MRSVSAAAHLTPRPPGSYRSCWRWRERRGLPTLLDSSGEGLRQGVTAAPRIIKVNLAEAEALLGRKLVTPEDQVAALDALRQWGSDWAMLTLGERGALFAAGERRWSAAPPTVEAIDPIGSGDAMTAGLMAGVVRGLPPEECFRLGMAAAAANTLTWDACGLTWPMSRRCCRRLNRFLCNPRIAVVLLQWAITASAHRAPAPALESGPG